MCKQNKFKSGFIAIVGKPNVGKSSLMNYYLGEKLSIITPKPQTTRQNIKGILTTKSYQIIFIDTPGFLKPRYLLQKKMQDSLKTSIQEVDIIIFMTEVNTFPSDYDELACKLIQKVNSYKIGVINKIDLATNSTFENLNKILKNYGFTEIFAISIKEDIGLKDLKEEIIKKLPEHPPYYPENDIATKSVRFFVEEMIREKIFLFLKKELPYSTIVKVEIFNESKENIEIYANIYVERRTQKKIVIGTKGNMIKKIRKIAEKDISYFLQKKVKLNLWIKIRKNWRKKERVLKEFGF